MDTSQTFQHEDGNCVLCALYEEQIRANFLSRELENEKAYTARLEALVDKCEPKAACFDLLTQAPAVQMIRIAAAYGMSADALYKLLHDLGILYKLGDSWQLYQRYADEGYTSDTTYRISFFITVTHTQWTEKGLVFLYNALRDHGILPLEQRYNSERK